MDSEVLDEVNKSANELNKKKKMLGTTMIALCLIGIVVAFAAGILLIVGVVAGNKVCEIVGIALNFLDIFTLGFSLVKTMIKFNANLAGIKKENTKE